MLTLDHIAIASARLQDGAAAVEAALGLPLQGGGQHAAMGTHNRLMGLGAEYLEVIAIDPEGRAPSQPRWFDLDRFRGAARATTWICRCDDLEGALAASPPGAGVAWSLSRGDLSWRMAVPVDGILPFDGLFPALIQWEGAAHPAPRLSDVGARLVGLRLFSPQADALRATLAPLIADARVTVVAADAPRMEAVIATPTGEVVL
ncbi:VOC family protein [Roseicyclus mahoneyensis]|uniref:Glyoxalase-like protein n=1 Tax=Roseicyclus mahoneyensis TaxID=164332 RepID=A0A316GM13_9RHOB|nr:VOC family protein [Roseicyclus mahoneyensis]PWK60959.1 glyoxalase-like protein [Roseicyclus mahoneyensis]